METHIKLLPVEIQGVGQKEFCIQPRIIDLMILQGVRRPSEEFKSCHLQTFSLTDSFTPMRRERWQGGLLRRWMFI
jgi:hypothetical protein